ncbi:MULTISPECIES: photosystem II reaction center PsbP [unclassified Microcystis]|uniref:photosystem II reaction center PsbP n=1 Tax=unclassified Microcystis TaxID=2643300 RepID=UPI0022BD3333|nr:MULTISPECIES: photosystem II reaction center PsbP [unclassified Microcystis]MCA2691835.1 photosystem II reaction center PsbP family protein [Microcystis sp. M034S2]MCA2749146.1 photosystem II reaction center PsbP family protein [Microcystis sp. M144S2]MCZ8199414.1 photosystem II reaction center PsbP [Microcystis sp. LE19-55.1A]MCZ8305193.1 photosystem II reaction center PsbP [Microcystis sp. LE19-98.1E]
MIKSLLATFLLITTLLLTGCATPIAGLQGYTSGSQGYQFLYPKGWTQVDVKKVAGVDVVFHDLIETSENLSVIINPIPDNKTLTDLGTPSEVGYRLLKNNSLNPNLDKEVELIRSESHQIDGQDYYILEYQVKLANGQERHNLASVTVNNHKLYSFNISTSQKRWTQIQELFETIVDSFSVS